MKRGKAFRVALIAGSLGRGGAEKQLFLMARSLHEVGADVRVWALSRGESYEIRLREAGVPVETVGGGTLPPLRLLSLAVTLRRFRPHVVQSCHTFTNLYAALAAKAAGAIGLGALRSTLGHSRRANGAWMPLLLRAPSAIVANSISAARELESRAGGPGRPVYVLPNVVDVSNAPPERPDSEGMPVRAVFVGRLIAVKRLDLFLQALAAARREAPQLVASVAGDGPERTRMEGLATRLGLAPDSVSFLGAVDAVDGLLRESDLLVLSSDEEGFPNVLLEAMAAGLPVITTGAGDAAVVVEDGRTGFVVPTGDRAAIAGRMVDLARSASLRRRLGIAGYQRARDVYGAAPLADRLIQIYRWAAEGANHREALRALR